MRWLRCLLILPLLSGCLHAPLRMQVPASLLGAPPVGLKRGGLLLLDDFIKAGPWMVRDISVSGYSTRCSQHLVSVDVIGRQSYRFRVASQRHTLSSACEIKRDARYLRFNDEPEGGHSSKLECKFHGFGEGSLLIKEALPAASKSGNATFGDVEWEIHSVHTAGGRIESKYPLGYEIWNGASPVAAIDTFDEDDARAWMDPALSDEDQQRVIGIASALLLFDPPAGYGWDVCR
jgi:hypothetical protein